MTPDKHNPSGSGSSDSLGTRASIFVRLCSEDRQQFEFSWHEFHDRYAPAILSFARRCGVGERGAADIVQDVLLGFFKTVPTFKYDPSKGRFRGYLKRATVNAVTAHWRIEQRSPSAVADLEGQTEDEIEKAWEHAWSAQILRRALIEARARYGERVLEAFELTTRGVPPEEIASRLGMSPAGVYQAKSRVSRTVREIIERIRGQEG